MPESNQIYLKQEITAEDIDLDDLLLLQDGHCFRNSILNLCRSTNKNELKHFKIESGSFETLKKLADEGFGTTLLPYLHTMNLDEKDKLKLRHFKEPKPAREISIIFPKSELKKHIIDALRNSIAGVISGAIAFHNVQIISPKAKK